MRSRTAFVGCVAALVVASTLAAAAQVGGKPVSGGNPTPGTPQPDPPNLRDRITLTGCLGPALTAGTPGAEAADSNTPSDSRFVLTGAQRLSRVPPGTGGSAAAAGAFSRTYRLEGLDSQFSPFVNAKVEISGEVTLSRAGGAPTLLVEFVRRLEEHC